MKLTIANMVVFMVALVGITAASTFAYTSDLADYGKPSPANSGMMLSGNVKVFHMDGNDNIIGIRQSENHIVGQGMEMIISQVFNEMNGTADAPTRPVSHMEIGHGGETELLMNDTSLDQVASGTIASCVRDFANFLNVTGPPGQGFGAASIVQGVKPGAPGGHALCQIANWGGESGGPDSADCSAQGNVTATGIFDGADCAGPLDIDEAAMWNDAVGGTMFARNNFGGVVLNAPDTLRLDWEFTFTDS